MKYLSTSAVFSQKPTKVDRKNGIIEGITIVQEGIAKGHNLRLNDKFVADTVRLGNEHTPGIKARFGHPNICATALGTYLGRFTNFRVDGTSALADMKLDPVSKKSPNGDLFNYVLDMAETNPDMFGASIAFKKGKFTTGKDKDGKEIKFATIDSLHAADFVDSPAATEGLFEVFHSDDLAAQVTMFLDAHPEIITLLSEKPEILTSFLERYNAHSVDVKPEDSNNLSTKISNISKWIKSAFSKSTLTNSDIPALQSTFESSLSDIETEYNTLLSKFETLESDFNALKASPTAIKLLGIPKLQIRPKKKIETFFEDAPEDVKKEIKKLLKRK